MCITMAAEAGQLELNYAEPVLYHKLYESIVALTGAIATGASVREVLREKAILPEETVQKILDPATMV